MTNRLLQALNEIDRARIIPLLEHREFEVGQVLVEQEKDLTVVAFPVTAQFTHEFHGPEDVYVETGWVGCEGVTAPLPLLAEAPSPWRITTRLAGSAWCIDAGRLRLIVKQSVSLREWLAKLALYYNAQDSLSTACAAAHPVLSRVARWALMASDHTGTTEIPVTQEEIARLLSSQRTSVVEAFSKLRDIGATKTMRGRVVIVDRTRLREAACACCEELDRLAHMLDVPVGGLRRPDRALPWFG